MSLVFTDSNRKFVVENHPKVEQFSEKKFLIDKFQRRREEEATLQLIIIKIIP